MKRATYAINRQDVVDEVIDGEAILINLKTGSYYSLEGSACAIWARLQRGPLTTETLARFVARAAAQDGDDPVAEAIRFVEGLGAEGLVDVSDEAPAPDPVEDADIALDPAPPKLSKYSDMEALLLIDPIHDVTPGGWPQQRGEDG